MEIAKADTPLKEDIYIYLLSQFEKFWALYPEKKSKAQAWETFQRINPNPTLFNTILQALEIQISNHEAMQLKGIWMPPWKYPANWLAKQGWMDEITLVNKQEMKNAHRKNTGNQSTKDMFCPEESGDENGNDVTENNVIQFHRHQ